MMKFAVGGGKHMLILKVSFYFPHWRFLEYFTRCFYESFYFFFFFLPYSTYVVKRNVYC